MILRTKHLMAQWRENWFMYYGRYLYRRTEDSHTMNGNMITTYLLPMLDSSQEAASSIAGSRLSSCFLRGLTTSSIAGRLPSLPASFRRNLANEAATAQRPRPREGRTPNSVPGRGRSQTTLWVYKARVSPRLHLLLFHLVHHSIHSSLSFFAHIHYLPLFFFGDRIITTSNAHHGFNRQPYSP